MPKLSKQTIEKRFQCQYCGETVRTRNGLLGHIQFKHKHIHSKFEQTAQTLLNTGYFLVDAKKAGLNEEEAEVLKQILCFWQPMVDEMDKENTKLNNTDYKNYLVVSLALTQANHLQSQYVVKTLAEGMAAGFSRLADSIRTRQ
jgi:DNA-directed RNA polymerase beta' subunit